jgi:hypothetical protein
MAEMGGSTEAMRMIAPDAIAPLRGHRVWRLHQSGDDERLPGGGSEARFLVSLDGAEARRWLHLSDDPLRADLVGFEWTNEQCTVSVIEVKAVQAKGVEYTVRNGVVDGPAVQQMLSTRRLLEQVFEPNRADELITTPARREILREHLYR